MHLLTAHISKAGGRAENQDHCAHRQEGDAYLWVVADGLGGHRGGEIASHLAVDAVVCHWRTSPLPEPRTVEGLFAAAQREILARQQEDPGLASMRTTLVLALCRGTRFIWGHVGDSRCYQLRNCAVHHQTRDHSVPQALADAGEISPGEIRGHGDRNILLRALGNPDGVAPAIPEGTADLAPGDALLLCSDGFWEYVTENEIVADLAKSAGPEEWLERMEVRLLSRSGEKHDNYTAIAVMTGE